MYSKLITYISKSDHLNISFLYHNMKTKKIKIEKKGVEKK